MRAGHANQLDALRAIAVAGVLLSHYARAAPLADLAGYYGVRLFFVLSGFLITGILLDCRALVERGQSAAFTLRQFYVRRFLRIVPAYYATLLVAYAAGVGDVRATIKWDLLYLTNVYLVRADRWLEYVSHFWSLAVEEQFYLVWPALVLFVPRRLLRPTVLAVVVAGVVFRAAWLASTHSSMAVWTLPFASLDSLGLGALLAVAGVRPGVGRPGAVAGDRPAARGELGWLPWLVGPAAALVVADVVLGGRIRALRLADSGWAVLCAYVIVRAAAGGFGGAVGRLLALRPLVYLGRISYGIYIVHLFVPIGYNAALRALALPGTRSQAVWALWQTALTVVVASLSWHWFERPINGIKRLFPYRRPGSPAVDAVETPLGAEGPSRLPAATPTRNVRA